MINLLMRVGATEVLSPQLLALVDEGAPLRLQQTVWHGTPLSSQLNRELAYDWRFTLAESDLPKVVGATGMAGVEVGFPLLDDRLVAFSQRLPASYKLRGLQLRWFFKEALRGFLPDAILAKKKQGFGLPFGVWANTHPALNALARDSLHSLAQRGVVRVDFVQALLTQRLRKLEALDVVERRRVGRGWEYHLTQAGEDLRPLVMALGHRQVHAVVGHDFGSPPAACQALFRPDVFRRVGLMSAPFGGQPSRPFEPANHPPHLVQAMQTVSLPAVTGLWRRLKRKRRSARLLAHPHPPTPARRLTIAPRNAPAAVCALASS